jgi:hypothetical protein
MLPTVRIDGARRIELAGLRINGGDGAVVGVNGAAFSVVARQMPLVACHVTGGTRVGIAALANAIGVVDGCTVENVDGDGLRAAEGGSLVVTNTTVRNNAGAGITATTTSRVRVGQDAQGTGVVRPVSVSGNGAHGIAIVDTSTGVVVGGTVGGNAGSGIFVGGGSSARIGEGAAGFLGALSVTANGGDGILVEGGYALIVGATIAGNVDNGIAIRNGGSARVGILADNSGYVGNAVAANGGHGVIVSTGASAFLGGNTIDANGTDPTFNQGNRFGVTVTRAAATLVGNNTVTNHPGAGVFVIQSAVRIGDAAFGLPTANTVSGNGNGGVLGALGGVFAFHGASIDVRGDTVIQQNFGQGVFAAQSSVIDLRESVVVTGNLAAPGQLADATDAGHGVIVSLNSTVRFRDAQVAVTSNTGNGVMLFAGGDVNVQNGGVQITGNARFGLRCFSSTRYTGNVSGVTGNVLGGNVDGTGNIPGCTRF